ncbi:hypothetical protein PR202_ga15904 [Eleusine coracana subsp. coracana]|uniref:Uncharacterized protein n=1 Tax=Eleusine coracana subsp. coracana TaxID=191504 RepID=A0AAV5CK93_ELECO|nr:hypothetical protein PR202_ga15904 [Eleusine coracana subsp. coracana]
MRHQQVQGCRRGGRGLLRRVVRTCESCSNGHKNYCPNVVHASNGVDFDGPPPREASPTSSSSTRTTWSGSRTACLSTAPRRCSARASPSRCTPPLMQYGLNAPGGVGGGGGGHGRQMVVVGAPSKPLELLAYAIIGGGKRVARNIAGSIADCQAMLDFVAGHGITTDIEVVRMDYVNTGIEMLERNTCSTDSSSMSRAA